jgi:hypothetical protein
MKNTLEAYQNSLIFQLVNTKTIQKLQKKKDSCQEREDFKISHPLWTGMLWVRLVLYRINSLMVLLAHLLMPSLLLVALHLLLLLQTISLLLLFLMILIPMVLTSLYQPLLVMALYNKLFPVQVIKEMRDAMEVLSPKHLTI